MFQSPFNRPVAELFPVAPATRSGRWLVAGLVGSEAVAAANADVLRRCAARWWDVSNGKTMTDLTGEPPYAHEDAIDIAAAPDEVYALVSDLARMGEWSPENRGGRWLEGGAGEVGDWFEGVNREGDSEWSAKCEIVTADRGKEFAFAVNGAAANSTRWTYRMEPIASGTRLTEAWSLAQLSAWMKATSGLLEDRLEKVPRHIRATLEAIKATAEAEPG